MELVTPCFIHTCIHISQIDSFICSYVCVRHWKNKNFLLQYSTEFPTEFPYINGYSIGSSALYCKQRFLLFPMVTNTDFEIFGLSDIDFNKISIWSLYTQWLANNQIQVLKHLFLTSMLVYSSLMCWNTILQEFTGAQYPFSWFQISIFQDFRKSV